MKRQTARNSITPTNLRRYSCGKLRQNKGFSFRTVSKNTRNGYRTPPTTPFFERQGRFHPVNGYEPLKDVAYFKTFQLNREIDTVVWPNNADFSPDFLYSVGMPAAQPN